MKKTLRMKFMLLLFALVVGIGNAWATDVTFKAGTDTSSSLSIKKDDITISVTSGTFSRTDNYRCYANNTMTISSDAGNISSITFTFSSSSYTGGWSTTYSPNSKSWTSSSASGQARITQIDVTYATATNYTVTISNTIANGSVTASPTSAAQNATIELTPSANSGYKLTSWSITKTSDGTASGITPTGPNAQGKYTFSMPAYGVTVGATFSQTYAVTCATDLENGSISAEPATAASGETITVTANPADNYKLKTVTVTETGGSNTVTPTIDGNSATFAMPAYPVTVSATFVRVYHFTYDANTTDYTGTTTDANVYESGASATVQANGFSKDGYTFSTWNTQADGNGTNYAPGASYTIGTEDVTLYAQWNIAKYNVAVSSVTGATVSAAYGNNTIAASANADVDCGTVIQLRADGLVSGKGIVWDVYKTGDATTKVTVTNNSFTLPAYNVTISGSVGHIFVKYTGDISKGDYVFYSDGAAMSNSISSSRFVNQTTNISVSGNEMVVTTDATAADVTWHIANISQTSYWTLYNADESSYGGSTSKKNTAALLESVTDYAKWTVVEDDNTAGAYDFINYGRSIASSDVDNKFLRKNGNNGWASYSTGQAAKPNIYKKSTSYQVDVTAAANGVITASTSGQSPIAEGANANIRSGATVTLTVTPDENFTIQSLTVYKTGTPATTVTVTNNQFTMPDYAVTVEVVFRSTATVTLTYSVNGEESSSDVSEGDITLKTSSDITVPTGYSFAGWSTSPSDFSTLYNESYSLSGNTTLYAVFSVNKPALFSFEITASDFNSTSYDANNHEKTIIATSTDTDNTIDVNWTSNQIMYNSSAMQWQKSAGYLYNSTDLGTIKSVTINSSEGSFTTYYGTSEQPSSGAAGSGKGYFKTSVGGATGKTSSVVVTFEKNAPFYFTRVIDTETATGDITINGPTIIEDGKSLNMGEYTLSNSSAANLIIEDGGQLILKNGNTVKATVKKSTEVSSAAKTAANNLYAIASPINNIAISSFAQSTHNVYRYDEPTSYWNEYRSDNTVAPYLNSFTSLEIGRGYLYRSSVEDIDLAGDVTGGNASGEVSYDLSYAYGVAAYKGLNLVGNPFTHDITWSDLTLEYVESAGCYMLVEDPESGDHGKWKAVAYGNVTVKPMQAFFVQAIAENASITFNNTTGGSKGINYANDNIMFSVKNSKCSDEAYVMFMEGHGLNKIEHRNNEIPMLYIMNNGQNYAIADMSDDTEVINVGFEAKTMGQYSISIKTEGQYSYMHLYDKVTGDDIDMLVEDSYTFVGAPNDRKDRFVLNLNYNAANINTESDIFAYQSGSDIIIRGDGELHVFDVMGRLVLTQRVNGVETISMQSQGVYIFKLNGMTQKIVVK